MKRPRVFFVPEIFFVVYDFLGLGLGVGAQNINGVRHPPVRFRQLLDAGGGIHQDAIRKGVPASPEVHVSALVHAFVIGTQTELAVADLIWTTLAKHRVFVHFADFFFAIFLLSFLVLGLLEALVLGLLRGLLNVVGLMNVVGLLDLDLSADLLIGLLEMVAHRFLQLGGGGDLRRLSRAVRYFNGCVRKGWAGG